MEINRDQLADHNGEMPSICRQCSQSLTQAKSFFQHWGFELVRRPAEISNVNGASETPEKAKTGAKS